MKIIMFAALLAAPVSAGISERLANLPTAEPVYCGLAVADSVLTASVIHRGGRERNPFLGSHPSDGKLAALAVGKCAGHAAMTFFLQQHASSRWVKRWEVLSIGIQGGVVAWNLHIRF